MAYVTTETQQYVNQTDISSDEAWGMCYEIGDTVPCSGIYRCEYCGDEITSNKGDPFPPQNRHQHPEKKFPVLWRLIVKTKTSA